jgi:drug/metabolite transporter (DMT)-like permease
MIIMYCLKIGPVGPTVTINNMGLLWPVILGALWLDPHPLTGLTKIGMLLVILSLSCFGLIKKKSSHKESNISNKWIFWCFLGWILAGVCMTAQLASSIYSAPPLVFVFAFSITAVLILSPFVIKSGSKWFNRKEISGGIINGFLGSILVSATLIVLNYTSSEIVFPFTVGGPVILILILGKFLYREHLDRLGWTACFLGVSGLIILSLV